MHHVLVVDDNPIDLMHVSRALRIIDDVNVITVSSAKAALRELSTRRFDVVFTDLRMPSVDGLTLLRQIRESDNSVPVVIMTAAGSENLAIEALRAGAANYVAKHEISRDLIPVCESLLKLAKKQQERSVVLQTLVSGTMSFCVPSDRNVASQLARHLQNAAASALALDAGTKTRVGVALEECLLNSVIHGNLEVSSKLRERDDNSYGELIEQRQAQSPYCDRTVDVRFSWSCDHVEFLIRDQGKGFSLADLPDPTDPMNLLKPSGRGVLLMKAFMDDVEYNDAGNEVRLVKYVDRLEDSADETECEPSFEILPFAAV